MNLPDRWKPDELAHFLAVARRTRLEAAWHLVAVGGLRSGELLGLRWDDVDLEAARIGVRHAVVGVPYAAIKPATVSRRERLVRLEPPTLWVLHEHRERQQAERSEWGSHYRDRNLVVCRENGEPLHPRVLWRALAQASTDAGLRPIGLSALRRSGASVAKQFVGAA